MSDTWVLKLPQVDIPEQPILVHVTKRDGHEVNLDLLATDGDAVYRGKLRARNYTKSKSTNYDGTDERWLAILKYTFVTKQASELGEAERKSLHIECAISGVEPKTRLTITIYSRIEDITHQLGQVELASSPDVSDVDLFGWSCQIIDQRDRFEDQIATGGQQAHSTQQTIAALQKQLVDLIQAKEEHEHQLLSKFTLLLDEKKLKIRNQQRILQTANVNARKLEAMQLTISGEQIAKPTSKRRRDEPRDRDEDVESDGFESMDIDNTEHKQDDGEEDSDDGGQATETASEDENDLDDLVRHEPLAVTKASPPRPAVVRGMSPPPPPRQLPFQKKSAKLDKPNLLSAKPIEDDEDTASEDDEL